MGFPTQSNQKMMAIACFLSLQIVNGFIIPLLAHRRETLILFSSSTPQPDMTSYAAGYQTVFQELPCYACTPSSGSLPPDLIGTYLRVGPAMFSAGSILPPKKSIVQPKFPVVPDGQTKERMVTHPFEADGGILALTFCNETTAIARFRYVRTNAFTRERKAGQRLYTAMDSTRAMGGTFNDLVSPLVRHHLQPGLNKFRKNISNTRVVVWANKLLTLWDGGLPYKLDLLALSTEGRSQLGGILKEEQALGAKTIVDPKRNRIIFFANKPTPTSSLLTTYEFNAKFKLTNEVKTELPGFALLSDLAVSENYYIVVQPPVKVNGMKYMFAKEPGRVLEFQNEPSVREPFVTIAHP
jgi:all-trans-8'-apo-beta-carotenal 15,15'-oxygenase